MQFNAEDINLLNGSVLSSVGSGVKGSLDTANASQRIALTVQDGKASFPSVGMGTKLPAYFDENNNLVPGPATSGSNVDTALINQNIARKSDSTDVNKKEDNFVSSPFSTTLSFDSNRVSNLYTQTAPIIFTLATSNKSGKKRWLTIAKTTDSITIPKAIYWRNVYPQDNKINDLHLTYLSSDSVLVEVNTRDANYANLIYSKPNQTTFTTYAGYQFTVLNISNPLSSPISVTVGTTNSTDNIVKSVKIPANGSLTIRPNARFDVATLLYINGLPAGASWSVNNPSLNNQ